MSDAVDQAVFWGETKISFRINLLLNSQLPWKTEFTFFASVCAVAQVGSPCVVTPCAWSARVYAQVTLVHVDAGDGAAGRGILVAKEAGTALAKVPEKESYFF